MTDNEIVKALECCRNNEREDECKYCLSCPMAHCELDEDEELNCMDAVLKRALDLIKRQKAEIERLRNTVKTDFLTVTEKLKLSQSEIRDIRAEAKKEFAELVKLEFYREFDEIIPSIMADRIDNLVAETTVNYESSKPRKAVLRDENYKST